MPPVRHAVVATTALLALLAVAGRTQQQKPLNQPRQINPTVPDQRDPSTRDPAVAAIEQRQTSARNNDRQKRLVSDTDKLLALATQLHDDVAKTDKNILSLDVIHRAEEIEKLARSVKERMKG